MLSRLMTEHADTSIWNNSSGHDFLEFNYFVTDGSFTADGGLL